MPATNSRPSNQGTKRLSRNTSVKRKWLNSTRFLNSALSGHPSRQKPLLRLPRRARNDTARRCSAEHQYTSGLQPRTAVIFVGPAVPSPTERARQDRTRPDHEGSRRISHSVTGSGEAMGRDGADKAVSWPPCQLPFFPRLRSQSSEPKIQ